MTGWPMLAFVGATTAALAALSVHAAITRRAIAELRSVLRQLSSDQRSQNPRQIRETLRDPRLRP
jgi:heme exporter protein D